MKQRILFLFLFSVFLFFLSNLSYSADDAVVEFFSPQGTVKKVRQVSVRFSEQMVPFGDPRLPEPFDITCPEKGSARWADTKNWIYDFDRDLSAGVVCDFKLNSSIKTLSGKPIKGQQKFSFSTGGPAIIRSHPYEGSSSIHEDQIFVLNIDADATEESMRERVFCSIEGVNERVGIKVLRGEERNTILKALRYGSQKDLKFAVIQCRQNFPNNKEVRIIWGKGVTSVSGVPTTDDQTLVFKTRSSFTAAFTCDRENPNANCIPLLPMQINFSSSVSWDIAKKIILRSNNNIYKPVQGGSGYSEDEDEGDAEAVSEEKFVRNVAFKGPFPENTAFIIEMPKDIKDEAGRILSNKDKYPLQIKTDAYPPLAKFSSRFGIVELKEGAMLPVTLRNLEPEVKTRTIKVDSKKKGFLEKTKEGILDKTIKIGEAISSVMPDSIKGEGTVKGLKGKLHKVQMNKEGHIIEWLKIVAAAERKTSILKGENEVKEFSLPKPGGAKAFEVVGIPLKEPGFYIVEMESQILGTSLLGEQKTLLGFGQQKPMYVPTAVLVTNLSVHFKWGRESSLIWVTSLDKGEPVKDADVSIIDCAGKLVWQGKTDTQGVAHIKAELPSNKKLDRCSFKTNYSEASQVFSGMHSGLFVFAKTSDDMTFAHSSWDEGIEPWRFRLPHASYKGPFISHTIFDRSLLRAGETVHMKHYIRKHSMTGFSLLDEKGLPKTIMIRHQGSDQRYEFPLKWDVQGIAETTWQITKDAKLGFYDVTFLKKETKKAKKRTAVGGYEEGDEEYFYPQGLESGSFRVEEFRVPLMKAIIQPLHTPLINASEAEVDLLVTYLSGGGAGNAQVKLRSMLRPRSVGFDGHDEFMFANGGIKEETIKRSGYERTDDEEINKSKAKLQTLDLILDKAGSIRAKIANLPSIASPQEILTELEFRDPNGEVQTVSQTIPLWPSKVVVGIKQDSWTASKDALRFQAVVLDASGKPVQKADLKTEMFQRKYYSHRKRLIGGFYAYEHVTEIKRIASLCEGKTDAKGLFFCEVKSPVSGNVILQATAKDENGNPSVSHREVWVAGKDEWWFDVSDSDRIDLIPEKKQYEPGGTAKFQVRMPFRKAFALITVEREGVLDTYVKTLSGKLPVVEVPVKNNYAPNVFVSVLVVRGRVSDVQPTALIDLGKPAYKLGIAEIKVGWKAHELKVAVTPEKSVYKVREKARVKIKVKQANGAVPPAGSEVAIAAVDEGLLELMQNHSWNLLNAMMGRRGYEVKTATAQMQVVGKRHYGLKALPQGGGGGTDKVTRELFETLLLWKSTVRLNEKGEALVEIPLNDSLTSFRIVAIASGGAGFFGTGHASIRTTQELMLLSGIPPLVREGDRFKAVFTLRNTSNRNMEIEVKALVKSPEEKNLEPINETLAPGESKEISWKIDVPYGTESIQYEASAKEKNKTASDSVKVKQKVVPAVPVRVFQATLTQISGTYTLDVEKPKDAVQMKGGIQLLFRQKLSNGLGGVIWYMRQYPYTCMEQKMSRAIALRDEALRQSVIAELPSHLDSDGLVKYFPLSIYGSDSLTAYILSITHEAGWKIPEHLRLRMENGLKDFIQGRIVRYSSLRTADLSIRKIAALEALSRTDAVEAKFLGSITIEPNLWPTSAVLDWMNVLLRTKNIPDRDKRLKEAEQIVRSRLNFQGTTMGFSTEATDYLWWLMVSVDVNSVKTVLALLNLDNWKEDMPRLVKGALSRQYKGAWSTTTANAWGVLAMEKFSQKFESIPVTGSTAASLEGKSKTVEWSSSADGKSIQLGWPKSKDTLNVTHQGTGKPWATIQSLAAIPLTKPFSSGYTIKKTIAPLEQKTSGKWSRGDLMRVKLEIEAQADMTWVVVNDPIPGGANILGSGLGRDSKLMVKGEKREGWVWPEFEERSFEAYRLYYEYVPKGKWTVEYTVRLNNPGVFHLPTTRVEALYYPEMLGELPNEKIEIGE